MAKTKQGTENLMAIIAGAVGGVIGDVIWNSIRLPGYDTPSQLEGLSQGDIIQMGGTGLLTGAGFMKGFSRLAPLAYGAFITQVLTKIIFPSYGLPRYLIFDLGRSGTIRPVAQFPR